MAATELIGRARSGDGEAFAELVDPYRREFDIAVLPRFGLLSSLPD